MEKKIYFRPGTYSNRIMYYVALSVEFPWRSLNLIPGDHTQVLRCIRLLKENGYISVHGSGDIKSIRLRQKALPILDKVRPGLYDYYMFNSGNHTFRGMSSKSGKTAMHSYMARFHRVAEVYCALNMVNAAILFNEKPTIEYNVGYKEEITHIDRPLLYNSKEIKNADPSQRLKIDFSRIVGLLVSEGGCYNIYNINNGLIKWNQYGENKAKVVTGSIINANFNGVFKSSAYNSSTSSAIIFAKDFDIAYRLIESNGSRKDSNGFELISFDNTYTNIYLLPLNIYGALQAKIITTENWYNTLMECVFGDEIIKPTVVDCDVYLESSDRYILTLFDGNVGRLKRFRASMYGLGVNRCEILCFPWQEKTIRKIVGDDVKISCIDTNELISTFFRA